MFNKVFEDIDKADIDALIADEAVEGKQLDYKEKLPGDLPKQKQAFIEDVCSFANASGGYMLFGLREKRDSKGRKTGTPEYKGLENISVDEQKLRLEHIILNGVEPRIPAIQIKAVEGFDNGPVLVVRIPQSWAAPHMARHNNRFYSRTSSGKYPLDVHEIRAAFALSEALPQRIREFRADRLGKIVAGETPRRLHEGAKTVLHIIPVSSFDVRRQHDLSLVAENSSKLCPIYASGWNSRYNFDGYLTYRDAGEPALALTYAQMFQNAAIEAVDTILLRERDGKRIIPSGVYERELLTSCRTYLGLQKELGVDPPLFIMLALVGVSGYSMALPPRLFVWDQVPIDRDTLMIPEVLVEDFSAEYAEVMRPMFYAIWNACGFERSLNYDKDHKWVGKI
jgi:hypothetical protein